MLQKEIEIFIKIVTFGNITMSNSVTKTRIIIISFIILTLSSTNALALQSSVNTQKINFWGYQLQNIDFKQLQDASFDLYVIDYAENGSNETTWGQQI